MAKLVDAHGSDPCSEKIGGSSPLLGTIFIKNNLIFINSSLYVNIQT